MKAVITAADLPELPMEWVTQGPAGVDVGANQRVILAREKALYHGHAFAAVAASTREIAVEAGKLIEVEWEVLEPVLSIDQALAADAPILHEGQEDGGMGPPVEGDTNITNQIVFEGGDLDAGWADADVVVEGVFETPMVHQGYIEPHACLVNAVRTARPRSGARPRGPSASRTRPRP